MTDDNIGSDSVEELTGSGALVAHAGGSSASLSPEERLWTSVLRRALTDFVLYAGLEPDHKNFKHGDNANLWFGSDDEDDIADFARVCRFLGLNPSALRRDVLKVTPDHLRRLRGIDFGDT